MPVLMRCQRLREARALLRRLPVPLQQECGLAEQSPHAGRADHHDVCQCPRRLVLANPSTFKYSLPVTSDATKQASSHAYTYPLQTSSIRRSRPIAWAAREKVSSVTVALAGSRRPSSAARLVFMRPRHLDLADFVLLHRLLNLPGQRLFKHHRAGLFQDAFLFKEVVK